MHDIIGALLERDAGGLLEFTRMTCDLIRAMRALPAPIVAALNGTAAGAGAVIAVASDLRVAADTARIAFLFVKVGPRRRRHGRAVAAAAHRRARARDRAPDDGRLRRRARRRTASASTTAWCPPPSCLAAARRWRASSPAGPAAGLAATKDALERRGRMDLEQALDHEARVQAELMTQPDFREGYDAFVDKRAPRFEGAPE